MLPPTWSCSSYQITVMNANNLFANRNQTILFFQPRFGNIDTNGKVSAWLHHDKGLFCSHIEWIQIMCIASRKHCFDEYSLVNDFCKSLLLRSNLF